MYYQSLSHTLLIRFLNRGATICFLNVRFLFSYCKLEQETLLPFLKGWGVGGKNQAAAGRPKKKKKKETIDETEDDLNPKEYTKTEIRDLKITKTKNK